MELGPHSPSLDLTKVSAQKVSRRGVLRGALLLPLLLTSCSSDVAPKASSGSAGFETLKLDDSLVKAAQKEGTLVVRTSSPVDFIQSLSDKFNSKYGITLQADRRVGVVGTQQFAVEERAGKHVVDVMWNSDPLGLQNLADEGFLQRYQFNADIQSRLGKDVTLPGNVGYGPYKTELVISYNPKLISTEDAVAAFSNWEGLLKPEFRGGKFGMTEPAGGSVPFATYLMFYREKKYGPEFLVKLAKQDPRLYNGSAPGREELGSGAIVAYITDWEYVAMQNYMKGATSQWTYPDIAPSFPATHIALSSNAQHPNAARLLAAWVFSDEGAAALGDLQVLSTLKGAADSRPAVEKLKQTDWWKPYPEAIKWFPDRADWDKSYPTLMPEMRQVLGWTS